jgi:predicted small metal-binding protein
MISECYEWQNISRKEVYKMAYTLSCKDAGVDCDFVARGETVEEVLAEGIKHVKEGHGYTDEEANDPKFLEEAKNMIKKT